MPQQKYKPRESRGPVSTGSIPPFSRANSSYRLSRTSTNTNVVDPYDNQSLRTLDRINSSKPSVTYSDKLWTQIDVLDDVKMMSAQVKDKGSFFNDKFNEELNKLKHSQEKLIDVMANQQNRNSSLDRPKMKKGTATTVESSESEEEEEDKKKKFKEFFGTKKKANQKIVYKRQNFDEMNDYVNEVKQSLQVVSESMKKFDDTTRDLW